MHGKDLRRWDIPDKPSCPMLASPLGDLADPFCPRISEHDGHDQRPATLDVLGLDALHLAAGQDVKDGGVEERDRLSSREGECQYPTAGAAAAAPTPTPAEMVAVRSSAFRRPTISPDVASGRFRRKRAMWCSVKGA